MFCLMISGKARFPQMSDLDDVELPVGMTNLFFKIRNSKSFYIRNLLLANIRLLIISGKPFKPSLDFLYKDRSLPLQWSN
jgi:hypothetical protein